MDHAGLAFHNVADLVAVPGQPGLRLQRMPEPDRLRLGPPVQSSPLCPTHAEVRWVPLPGSADDDGVVRLTLHSVEHHEYLSVFNGDSLHQELCLHPGETRTIELPGRPVFGELHAAVQAKARFGREVWRVRISGTGRVHFISRAGIPVRPPLPAELPGRTLLAHGSSITMGFAAPRLADPWIQHVAEHLRWDVLNLGFGGACHVEEAMAHHIAGRADWHACVLELGVNLIGHRDISTSEFARRVRRFIAVVGATGRPVLLLNILPLAADLQVSPDAWRMPEELRAALRAAHRDCGLPHVALLDGTGLLPLPGGLTTDLVHPSAVGHAVIGVAVAARLHELLADVRHQARPTLTPA